MKVVLGESLLALGLILFAVVAIGARNPRRPAWAAELLLENVYPPLIIVIWFFGVFSLAMGFPAILNGGFRWMEGGLFLIILVFTIYLLKRINMGGRLAEFERRQGQSRL